MDRDLVDVNTPFSFGTNSAIVIFMYSFSGGQEKGVTVNYIKLSSVNISIPSIIIAESVSKIKRKPFLYFR